MQLQFAAWLTKDELLRGGVTEQETNFSSAGAKTKHFGIAKRFNADGTTSLLVFMPSLGTA